MRSEDRILFLCSRQEFTNRHKEYIVELCANNHIDWGYVFSIARKDGVAPLVGKNLCQIHPDELNITTKELEYFKQYQIQNMFIKHSMEKIIREVLCYFDQKEIDVMFIKGEALNLTVYAKPWFTTSADIDLVLRPRHKIAFSDNDIKELNHYIYQYNKEKTIFQQHLEYDLYEHHDVTMNNIIPIDFQRIWNDAILKTTTSGYQVYVMTPEDTLIALAVNSCRKRYFYLKNLCDIAEVIQTFPDVNWDELVHKARQYHCNNIVFTALNTTQQTVGCLLPDNLLADLSLRPIKAALIKGMVRLLLRIFSLYALSLHTEKINKTHIKKGPSLSLLVTYSSYSLEQLWRKIWEQVMRVKQIHF